MALTLKQRQRQAAHARRFRKPIGYSSNRARKLDRARHSYHRPRKRYKRGVGNEGDWNNEYSEFS